MNHDGLVVFPVGVKINECLEQLRNPRIDEILVEFGLFLSMLLDQIAQSGVLR